MARRIDARIGDLDTTLAPLLAARGAVEQSVRETVREIVATVRERGDDALLELTRKFDRFPIDRESIRVDAASMAEARAACGNEALDALAHAAERIRAYHARHIPEDTSYQDESGVTLGEYWTPVEAVGLYVPGGTASYPSSVLMNAIPAQVAGVPRLVATVPHPDGQVLPLVLAAAELAGIREIYRVGGAQAVAALSFGTDTIAPVDKIVGPGNAYVAEAKRQVFGTVGIDLIAGPSEILVVADAASNPEWVALDLLSQAEHDPAAQAVLVTDDSAFADAVENAVERHLETLPRRAIAGASWREFGAVIVVAGLADAPAVVNRLAPEHVELSVTDPEPMMRAIRTAGAVFLGRHTPEAIGDYVAGPSHVLPTSRSARFSSGLSVRDFLRRTSVVGCSEEGLAAIGPSASVLAEAEGLDAHRLSVDVRLGR
ncbi:MAG: histidinol dehydrogenase [Rhodospirillales bacterium]|nr:histidinol dehydrogenase [Rhodospirillales bacterium]